MSIPGTEAQKAALLDCGSCHTLERVMRSTHNSDEWTQVISRMRGYGAVSQPIKPQPHAGSGSCRHARAISQDGRLSCDHQSELDPTIGLMISGRCRARQGRDTRAIVTEYDMVRPTTEPHDILRR